MNLEQIKNKLQEDFKSLGLNFTISETYIDFGANWKANTIIVVKGNSTYQALSPAQIIMMGRGRGGLKFIKICMIRSLKVVGGNKIRAG